MLGSPTVNDAILVLVGAVLGVVETYLQQRNER